MDSSAPSLAGDKQLQGIGEVQAAIKCLQEQVGESKVSWGSGLDSTPPARGQQCRAL